MFILCRPIRQHLYISGNKIVKSSWAIKMSLQISQLCKGAEVIFCTKSNLHSNKNEICPPCFPPVIVYLRGHPAYIPEPSLLLA